MSWQGERPRTLVSLFSGAGGLDAGLETAGFTTVAATDHDRDCCKTLEAAKAARLPIPGRPGATFLDAARIIRAPVADLHASDLRPDGAGLDWSPDILVGGPPCQPFSSAGHQRSVEDPRGRLFEEFVRLATELRPRFILFENVRGLVTAKGPNGLPGEAIVLVREAFEAAGYATRFALLNAADHGAPQRRVRLIMFGARSGPLPAFPELSHARDGAAGRLPWLSLGELLATLPPDDGPVVRPSPALAAALSALPDGCGVRSSGAREATRPGGHWGYRQGTFIADRTLPARTVTASASQDWIRLPDGSLRRLTLRECAAIQGFPSGWPFAGSAGSRFRQVGNAVPARFGIVLGGALREALGTPETERTASAPWPAPFTAAIAATLREHRRNGASRDAVRAAVAAGAASDGIKGRGRADVLDRAA